MAETVSGAASAPPPTADSQDPLPESDWTWRRGLTVAVVVAVLAMSGVSKWMIFHLGNETLGLVGRIANARDAKALDGALSTVEISMGSLLKLGMADSFMLGLILILYLVAPSAEQVVKMLATVSAWKGGISTASFARSRSPDGSQAEDVQTAGPAVAPVAPAPPKPPAPTKSEAGATPVME